MCIRDRHNDNNKWYGVVLEVSADKLGLPEAGIIDVLNAVSYTHLLDVDVARLKVLKADHQSQQYRLEDKLMKYFPAEIEKTQGFIKRCV